MTRLSTTMSEADLYESVRQLALLQGLLIYHTQDSRRSYSGFPDLVIVGPGGVLFRELKAAGKQPTPEQRTWLKALTTAGADAGVWHPEDWHSRRIDAELGQLRRRSLTGPPSAPKVEGAPS